MIMQHVSQLKRPICCRMIPKEKSTENETAIYENINITAQLTRELFLYCATGNGEQGKQKRTQ
jgi:hypothetical protein